MPDDLASSEEKPKLDVFGLLVVVSAVALIVAAIVGVVYVKDIQNKPPAPKPAAGPGGNGS